MIFCSVADGVSHFICQSPDDVVRYFEDGRKVSQSLHQTKFATVFNLKVQQRVKGVSFCSICMCHLLYAFYIKFTCSRSYGKRIACCSEFC